MKCPICNADSHVQATRGEMRKRQCAENPSHCFETLEDIAHLGRRPSGRRRKEVATCAGGGLANWSLVFQRDLTPKAALTASSIRQIILSMEAAELAKLHKLGGEAWVRAQINAATAPRAKGTMRLCALTFAERTAVVQDARELGATKAARKYHIKRQSVYYLMRTHA